MNVMRCYFGGIEMIMAVGMLQAAELNMIILVDGFHLSHSSPFFGGHQGQAGRFSRP